MSTANPSGVNFKNSASPGGSAPLPGTSSEQNNHWDVFFEYAQRRIKQEADNYREQTSSLLFVASVIAAVVGPFAIESYHNVRQDPADTTALLLRSLVALQLNATTPQPNLMIDLDPQSPVSTSARRVNICFFISLILSLIVVVLGIVASQWIHGYDQDPSAVPASREGQLGMCQIRSDGMKRWYAFGIFTLVPTMLLSSLLLFFAGITGLLWEIDGEAALAVLALILATSAFLLITTILPALQIAVARLPWSLTPPYCPYKSPQAWVIYRLAIAVSDFLVSKLFAGLSFTLKDHRFWVRNWDQYDWWLYQTCPRPTSSGFSTASPIHWLGSIYVHEARFADALYNCLLESARWDPDYIDSLENSLASSVPRLSQPLRRAKDWSRSPGVTVQGADAHVSDVAVFQALTYLATRTEKGQPSAILLRRRLELFMKIQEMRPDPEIDCPLLTKKDLEKLIPPKVWRDVLRCIFRITEGVDVNTTYLNAIVQIVGTEIKMPDPDMRLLDNALDVVENQIRGTRRLPIGRRGGAQGQQLLEMEQTRDAIRELLGTPYLPSPLPSPWEGN